MKKIVAILAAVVALAAASCNKAELINPQPDTVEDESTVDVKVNITVGSLTPETKAIKKSWENGDVINVYLDDATSYKPDFTLTYTHSSWNASKLSESVIARLKETGGYLHGFWEGSNSCSSWSNKYSRTFYFPGANADYDQDLGSSTGVTGYLMADFHGIAYTFDPVTGCLQARIDKWEFQTNFHLVVSGITYEEGRYTLYSDQVYKPLRIEIDGGDTAAERCCIMTAHDRGSDEGRIAGIPNKDGVAFVGKINDAPWPGVEFTFKLIDNDTEMEYTFIVTMQFTSDNMIIMARNLPFNKMYVDMGLPSGTMWCAANLGAGTFTDGGDYYAWGETETKTEFLASNYKWEIFYPGGTGQPSHHDMLKYNETYFFDIYKDQVDHLTLLELDDDAAYKKLGYYYRMPSKKQFSELLNNCTSKFAEYDGVKGFVFTSKIAGYEKQSVFFPCAGYCDTGVSYKNYCGFYWSTNRSEADESYAYFLYMREGYTPKIQEDFREEGRTIRPVYIRYISDTDYLK